MRSWLFVVLVACGGGSAKPAPSPVAKPVPPTVVEPAKTEAKPKPEDCANLTCAIAILDDFSKQMCACKDKACVAAVTDKLQTWSKAIENKPGLDVKPDDEQARQLSDSIQRFAECSAKLGGDDDDVSPKKPSTGLGGGMP